MSVIRNSVILRCAPEVVFDYLSDLRAELEWNPNCEGMEKLTDGPVGLGTRYRAKWKGSPVVELETVAFERPHGWTMHNGGPIEITFTCRLEPVPEGTRLHADNRPNPTPLVPADLPALPDHHPSPGKGEHGLPARRRRTPSSSARMRRSAGSVSLSLG